ncbi:MAG: hypothetical protein M1365_05675, partial [Actinobacteria bacterium]|nr:hypothetical protein [Actinomycetota bacterium]
MRKVKYFTIFKPHIDNVRYSIEKLRENDEIDLLFSSLECLGGLILVGGAIRDLAVSAIPRDFDIIVDTEIENLNRTLGNFRCQRNRFGGYKLNIFSYNFDVWCIQDNWAFKHHYIETKVENIKYSSFFNVDSLVLHLKEDYWDVSSFNEAIESNLLDIVLGEEM